MREAGRALPTGTVTFLFSDIEGSTRLARELGSAWPAVLAEHRRLLRAAFELHAGNERSTEGDSFFVAFADAPSAVAAAADAQRALAGGSWPAHAAVRVRIGLHSGEGRLADADYVGLDVHRAARIAAAGHGGQVLISESTGVLSERDLPEGVSLRDLGEHRLKDLPETEHLFQLVIDNLPSDFPRLRSLSLAGGNLPEPMTRFIGRERELEEVHQLLRVSRLLTLVGPGGTGKTRLVVEVARRAAGDYRDGAWFVGLAATTDAKQLPATIAGAIGVGEVGVKPPEAVLRDHFRPRQCLLILDNFEHLIEAAPIVAELVSAAADLTVAATSQAQLRLSGEQVYPVPPLSVPGSGESTGDSDAVRLFVDRATRARPDFRLTPENAPTIAEICRRLDGLPLAIELAAARVRLLSVDDILVRLGNRLQLLTGGPSDVPDRQRTLRGAIAWTHELLGPAEANLFRRLAVFSGASIAAIEHVCADASSSDTLSTLDDLAGHSLIIPAIAADETRFRMLETIREFALERLRESGEEPALRRRHAEWLRDALAALAPAWRLDPAAGQTLEPEIDNVRAALGWADDTGETEIGLRICGSAWRLWVEVGALREGYDWVRRFLARPQRDGLERDRILALEGAGGLAFWLGDAGLSADAYRERVGLAKQYGTPADIADAAFDLSLGVRSAGSWADSKLALSVARSGYLELNDQLGVAHCRMMDGQVALFEQRFKDARDIFGEVLPVLRKHGDFNYLGPTLGSLAMCQLLEGDLSAADRSFTEILAASEGRTSLAGLIAGVGAWSRWRRLGGNPEEGARLAGAYTGLSQTYGVSMPAQLAQMLDAMEARLGVRDELEPDVRERIFEEGRRMTVDQVRQYVRLWLQERLASGEEATAGARQ